MVGLDACVLNPRFRRVSRSRASLAWTRNPFTCWMSLPRAFGVFDRISSMESRFSLRTWKIAVLCPSLRTAVVSKAHFRETGNWMWQTEKWWWEGGGRDMPWHMALPYVRSCRFPVSNILFSQHMSTFRVFHGRLSTTNAASFNSIQSRQVDSQHRQHPSHK